MSFRTDWESKSGIAIERLQGELTGPSMRQWRQEFNSETKARGNEVLLDLTKLEMISSEALGALLSAAMQVRRAGGDLKLLNLPPFVCEVFLVARLLGTFEIFNEEQVALRSFVSVRAQQSNL